MPNIHDNGEWDGHLRVQEHWILLQIAIEFLAPPTRRVFWLPDRFQLRRIRKFSGWVGEKPRQEFRQAGEYHFKTRCT
jgi:hypothetical protein